MPDGKKCFKAFYKNRYCVAVLAPEQLSEGHTLVILRNHIDDISFKLKQKYLSGIIAAINKVSGALVKHIKNENNESPERIYVCSLCDGVKHLHFHLIPRFPYTYSDKISYLKSFAERDGIGNVIDSVIKEDMGGFWYVALREQQFRYDNLSDIEKKKRIKKFNKSINMIYRSLGL